LKDQQNECHKREDNLKRQLDKLTYDNSSLRTDLSASATELDEARQNISVTIGFLFFRLCNSGDKLGYQFAV